MERFIRLFERNASTRLVADREFIGKEWTGWLNSRRIRYYIRYVRTSGLSSHPPVRIRAWWLFNDLKVGQRNSSISFFLHKGEYVYLAGSRIKNSDGVPNCRFLYASTGPRARF